MSFHDDRSLQILHLKFAPHPDFFKKVPNDDRIHQNACNVTTTFSSGEIKLHHHLTLQPSWKSQRVWEREREIFKWSKTVEPPKDTNTQLLAGQTVRAIKRSPACSLSFLFASIVFSLYLALYPPLTTGCSRGRRRRQSLFLLVTKRIWGSISSCSL